ncbi:MAG: sulfate permease [Bacteroidales bacterium]|jgi:SulP family sulfate permease|nr:sulfate permease [Bacteroidales bacterium]
MKFTDYISFKPRLFTSLKTYNKQKFFADLLSGVIVGIIALPMAIAFGIASGVSPEKGIITAIVAGFLISFFGGSDVQIGGPTGAFIVIVYGIVQQFGETGLIIATIMAGLILLLMGFFKLGSVIKFIPYPIVVGFTSGIAVTIFSTQINDFFGLKMTDIPSDFIHKWGAYFQNFSNTNFVELGVGILSLLIIIFTPKLIKKIPGSLIAIIVLTIIVFFLNKYNIFGFEIETIGNRYAINANLPRPITPKIDFAAIQQLLPAAFSIAILGAIESLLSATVADGVLGTKHDSNTELIGQGIANIITPLFGGIPATGAIARTMANINNGGRTPVAGMIHAVILLLILLFLGSLTKYIPMACLAAILIIVAYNMSEWRTFKSLLKNPLHDVIVLLLTFFLTVIFDLTIAIQFGLLIAAVLFMKRVYDTSKISVITNVVDINQEIDVKSNEEKLILPDGVEVYEIDGPFFFGIANKLEEMMKLRDVKPKVRIIRMRKVPFIDSTGIHNLETLYRSSKNSKVQIILSGVNDDVLKALINSGFADEIGRDNICSHIDEAVVKARWLVESE